MSMPGKHRLDAEALAVESFSADSATASPQLLGNLTTLTYEGGYTCAPNRTCPDCGATTAA
jgi:hypothetical protein